ncbi:hypothetical protein BDW02DRAFT_651738 [Decorospora gaudefroyi]|uniref:Uncharacterized protein n=1 Tax=Decorospora gaudefroyi TaxID=184978 RepID=A0A6A5JWF0_9PLEO|nr:hypothetical protein BDW02DRAFT_651738 [Decorospora gaudefroyi]
MCHGRHAPAKPLASSEPARTRSYCSPSVWARQICCIFTLIVWALLYYGRKRHGFIIRRRGLSTDTLIGFCIGMTSFVWAAIVVYSGLNDGYEIRSDGRTAHKVQSLLADLAQAPVLVVGLFFVWLISGFDILVLGRNRSLTAWRISEISSSFDWDKGLQEPYYFVMCIAIPFLSALSAGFQISTGDAFLGVLNLAGVLLFATRTVPRHPFNSVPHRYAADELRIILPTTHHEGTVYVLPSKNRGFDAVWSPKIPDEHIQADRYMMTLFSKIRSVTAKRSDPLESIRATVAAFHKRLSMSTDEIECLAEWIYPDEQSTANVGPRTRKIECQRAPGIHLIGRDMIYALCHAEYIVFMGQGRLSSTTRAKLARLRFMKGSGASSEQDVAGAAPQTIGLTPGFEGYSEAVRHVYAIFNLPVDDLALDFSCATAPAYSHALGMAPSSIDEYVSKLWDLSIQHSESTFTALYFFNVTWFMEVGNVNGFHIFPLRVNNRDGDVVDFDIIWRQIWWEGCVSQLPMASLMVWDSFRSGCLR